MNLSENHSIQSLTYPWPIDYYSRDDAGAESYNVNKHRTVYLDYTYKDGGNTFHVNDSLVFVDTDVKFDTFAVKVT